MQTDSTSCIEPEGRRNHGYVSISVMRYGKRIRHAHVLALIDHLGRPLHPGYQANHACDNRACISTAPGHIYEGTQSENITESVDRQRHGQVRKDCCPKCGSPWRAVEWRKERICPDCTRVRSRRSSAAYRSRKRLHELGAQ